MSGYYTDDDYQPRNSPGLQIVKPKSTPSPSPPPIIPRTVTIANPTDVSPNSSKKRNRSNKPKRIRPSQGDAVLIHNLDPNRPDIARIAAERALNSGSDSEPEDTGTDGMAMTGGGGGGAVGRGGGGDQRSPDLMTIARDAYATFNAKSPVEPVRPSSRVPIQGLLDNEPRDVQVRSKPSTNRDSGTGWSEKEPSNGIIVGVERRGSDQTSNGVHKHDDTSRSSAGVRSRSISNSVVEERQAISPLIEKHGIQPSRLSPSQTLPALLPQNLGSPSKDEKRSPDQNDKLPGFDQLQKLADAASNDQQRANGYPHRQSFSSTGGPPGHSPTLLGRPFPNGVQQGSPPSAFPPFHTSPISAHSDTSPRDPFYAGKAGLSPPGPFPINTLVNPRRTSQASDTGPPPFSSTGPSPSESFSPGSQSNPTPTDPAAHRMSIDGVRPDLSNQGGQPGALQQVPSNGGSAYKCEHPGCTAPPFQTQYLLNSHANVHSQIRPHYCTVPGCPRGEGGRGFKRKNEMIRHGLVHESPGYVCPFCPEREHKYPRPDNLQRHVRVHHADKDKDHPLLREVLAQRPEGGTRGRRRRAGS